MNARQCLALAERMDSLLRAALGCGVQPQRMLADPLYARDVLLVCDAHAGSELQLLARDWRAARAEAEAGPVPAQSPSAAAARARPRAQAPAPAPPAHPAPAGRSAPTNGRPAAAPTDNPTAARLPQHKRPPPADSGLSSFFDRFRASGPASLPAGRSSTRPLTLGLDGPDTWPPEADGPLPEALDPGLSRPVPPAPPDAGRGPGAANGANRAQSAQSANSANSDKIAKSARAAWFSPARWFERGPR